MKHPDAKEISKLTRKLKMQGDISLKEANKIFALLSQNSLSTKLNPNSSRADNSLINALGKWFWAVADRIKQGKRGNFIFTVGIANFMFHNLCDPKDLVHVALKEAKESLGEHGNFEEIFSELLVDKKAYNLLPKELRKFFTKKFINPRFESYYIFESPRACMYYYPIVGNYSISQLVEEKFLPIMKSHSLNLGAGFFEIASGVIEVFPHSQLMKEINRRKASKYVIAAYMREKGFPCMIMAGLGCKSEGGACAIVFTEKDKAPIVKEAFTIPFEDIVKNALNENVIDEKLAKELSTDALIRNFPAEDFIRTGAKYIDKTLQVRREWKPTRNMAERELEWPEEIR